MDATAFDDGRATAGDSVAVKVLGRLSLPEHSSGTLPDASRAAYGAVNVLTQHIISLQPEASDASVDIEGTGASKITHELLRDDSCSWTKVFLLSNSSRGLPLV